MVTLRTHSSAAGHFPPRVFSPLPRRVHTQHTHRAQRALGTHSASSRWALSCSQTFSQNPPLTPIPKCLFSQNGRVLAPGWLGWERVPAGSEAVRTTGMGAHTHTHTHRHKRHTHANTHVHTPAPGHQPCLRSQEFPEHRAWGHRQPFHGQGGWPQDDGTPSPGCLLCQGGGPEPRMCTGASGIHLPLLLLRGVRAALRGGRVGVQNSSGMGAGANGTGQPANCPGPRAEQESKIWTPPHFSNPGAQPGRRESGLGGDGEG